jgi:hypothetical protein
LPLSPNRYKLRNLFFIAFIYIVASTVPPVWCQCISSVQCLPILHILYSLRIWILLMCVCFFVSHPLFQTVHTQVVKFLAHFICQFFPPASSYRAWVPMKWLHDMRICISVRPSCRHS